MHLLKGNPAARGEAGRARDMFRLATNGPEIICSPFEIQLAYLARRGLSPTRAATIAVLAFVGASR